MPSYTSKEVVVVIRNFQHNAFGHGIPRDAFLPGEIEFLEALGFDSEPDDFKTLYFWSEVGRTDKSYSEIDDEEMALISTAAANGAIWANTLILSKEEGSVTVVDILREILARPYCEDINAISITGSYLADKMVPDGFGGFVDYITRDVVRSENTYRILLQMIEDQQDKIGQRKGPQP